MSNYTYVHYRNIVVLIGFTAKTVSVPVSSLQVIHIYLILVTGMKDTGQNGIFKVGYELVR